MMWHGREAAGAHLPSSLVYQRTSASWRPKNGSRRSSIIPRHNAACSHFRMALTILQDQFVEERYRILYRRRQQQQQLCAVKQGSLGSQPFGVSAAQHI